MKKVEFELEKVKNIQEQGQNKALKKTAHDFILQQVENKYTYNFTWLGMPIIQFPQDIIALQELIWEIKPDVIIETGGRKGGLRYFLFLFAKINWK